MDYIILNLITKVEPPRFKLNSSNFFNWNLFSKYQEYRNKNTKLIFELGERNYEGRIIQFLES